MWIQADVPESGPPAFSLAKASSPMTHMVHRIRRDKVRSRFLHRCLDIGINWLALVLAYAVKEGFSLGTPTEPISTSIVISTFAVVALLWLAVCSALETYSYKRRLFSEIVNLVTVLIVTIAFFTAYVYFVRPFEVEFRYPRYVVLLYGVVGAGLLALSRAVKHTIHRALHRHGIGTRRLLIVGTDAVAQRLADACRNNHALGYAFIGFVTPKEKSAPDRDHLGTVDELESIIQDVRVEEIIIALPGHQHQEMIDIAHRCQAVHVRLRVVPDLFDVIMIRATLSEIDDVPLIGLRDPVLSEYQGIVKRCFDVVTAVFCLLLASPLFILLPIAIWLDSRGRVFFSQMRVGENGKPFRMYKFRSMVPDAEDRLKDLVNVGELAQPAFKIQDDPRVTRLGRILRRTSLDELPQLINVVKGDMSMVGPRPEEMQVVQHYKLWHRKRLSVKPGITGPMQVSGRGELSLDERINLELMYIGRYSILEDFKYLLRTIPAVCRAHGAY